MLEVTGQIMTIEALYKYGTVGEYSESLFAIPKIWFSSPRR